MEGVQWRVRVQLGNRKRRRREREKKKKKMETLEVPLSGAMARRKDQGQFKALFGPRGVTGNFFFFFFLLAQREKCAKIGVRASLWLGRQEAFFPIFLRRVLVFSKS